MQMSRWALQCRVLLLLQHLTPFSAAPELGCFSCLHPTMESTGVSALFTPAMQILSQIPLHSGCIAVTQARLLCMARWCLVSLEMPSTGHCKGCPASIQFWGGWGPHCFNSSEGSWAVGTYKDNPHGAFGRWEVLHTWFYLLVDVGSFHCCPHLSLKACDLVLCPYQYGCSCFFLLTCLFLCTSAAHSATWASFIQPLLCCSFKTVSCLQQSTRKSKAQAILPGGAAWK